MLWAMTRRAPAARAAAKSEPATSLRSWLVVSKPRFTARGLADCARLVSWLMTTSGWAASTARRTASWSKASPTAGTTPGTPSAATLASWRENTVTACPAETNDVTSGRPMAPVPPATKIRIRPTLRGHGADPRLWQDGWVSEHSGYPGAPPGWYADPAGGPGQRWWDGYAWSEATVLPQHPPPPPWASAAAPQGPATQVAPWAVASDRLSTHNA